MPETRTDLDHVPLGPRYEDLDGAPADERSGFAGAEDDDPLSYTDDEEM